MLDVRSVSKRFGGAEVVSNVSLGVGQGAIAGFDVQQDFNGMRGVAERTAFLVDEGGTVRSAWRYETGEVPDMDELLAAARASSA